MTVHDSGPRWAGDKSGKSAVIVGLGARQSASADDVLALVSQCLRQRNLTRTDVQAFVTHRDKLAHPALIAAAAHSGVSLAGIEDTDMAAAAPTPSARVEALFGRPSVAEASAMAFGPLLLTKQKSANVTCALALVQPSVDLSAAPSTAMASSTVPTSLAGP